jgi:hypothetical protein
MTDEPEKKPKKKTIDITVDLRSKLMESATSSGTVRFVSELLLASFFDGNIKLVRKTLMKMWQAGVVIKDTEQEHDMHANTHHDRWTLTEYNTNGVTYPMYMKAVYDEQLQAMAVAIGSRLSFVMAADYREKFKGNEEVLSQLKQQPQAWVEAIRRCLDDALIKGDITL